MSISFGPRMPIYSANIALWTFAVREGYRWWAERRDGVVRLWKDDGTFRDLDAPELEDLEKNR